FPAEVVVLKTVGFKSCITDNSGILGPGCHSCRRELHTKTGCVSLNAAFCRLVFFATTVKSDRYGGSVWESNVTTHGISRTYEELQGAQSESMERSGTVNVP